MVFNVRHFALSMIGNKRNAKSQKNLHSFGMKVRCHSRWVGILVLIEQAEAGALLSAA